MTEEQKCDNEPVKPVESAAPAEPARSDAASGTQGKKIIKLYMSHDGIFRAAFEDEKVVKSFIMQYLPGEITRDLDLSTLKQDKDTFIDTQLTRSGSDVVYNIRFKNDPALLYFLYEHKSFVPVFPALQLLKNMTFIWEGFLSKHKYVKKLPVIIPVLVYHGEDTWRADTNFISAFGGPEDPVPVDLVKYIPAFNYVLTDVSHMPEEQIKGELELRIIFLAFRIISQRNISQAEILARLREIFLLLREITDKTEFSRYLEMLLVYLSANIRDLKPGQLREAVNDVLIEGGTTMKTIYQQLVEEGEEIGVKKGKEIGVKEGEEKNNLRVAFNCIMKGMDSRSIAEITEMPVERIESMKAGIHRENAAYL
jgi:predicted transposase/invertase (TIGR01784 family)